MKMINHVFIAESGATSHMGFSNEGKTDLVDYKIEIKVGNNGIMKSKAKGTFNGIIIQEDGSTLDVSLKNVLYMPDLWVNLLSLIKAIKNPKVKIMSKEDTIMLQIRKKEIIYTLCYLI